MNKKSRCILFCAVLCLVLAQSVSGQIAGTVPNELDMYLMPNSAPRNVRVNHLYRSPQRDYIVLDGDWEFQMDVNDNGINDQWYASDIEFSDKAPVPGALEALDLGHHRSDGQMRTKYKGRSGDWQMRTKYKGRFWYRRTVNIPAKLSGKVIWLNIGGALPEAAVWVNGQFVGARFCDLTAFSYEVSKFIKFGQDNSIVISIDNRDRQARSRRIDDWRMIWSGIWRNVELEAISKTSIDDVFVIPDIDVSTAVFEIKLSNKTEQSQDMSLDVQVTGWKDSSKISGLGEKTVTLAAGAETTVIIPVGIRDMQLWSPKSPHLYKFEVSLSESGGKRVDSWMDRFGMSKLEVEGGRLMMNNAPLFVKGNMCQFDFPDTISLPPIREAWRERVREFKKMGCNYLRLPGSIAPGELCDIADEEGILLSSAVCDNGTRVPFSVSNPKIAKEYALSLKSRWWWEQTLQLRNHVSIFMYVLTNEGHLSRHTDLPELYRMVKKLDPTNFVVNCDGPKAKDMEAFEETDFWIPVTWPTEQQRKKKPFMVHEYVNISTLPDISTLPTHDQPLRCPWLEHFVGCIKNDGLIDIYPRLLESSHFMQREWVKLSFEGLRFKPDADGYMACTQRDADGIAYSGFIGRFGKLKAISFEDLRQWQAETVLLCNLVSPSNATYYYGDTVSAEFSVSHLGAEVIHGGRLSWSLLCDGDVVSHGQIENINIAPYQLNDIAKAEFSPSKMAEAKHMILVASLESSELKVKNQWDLWFFPKDQWLSNTEEKVLTQIQLPEHITTRYSFLKPYQESAASEALLISDNLADNLDFVIKGGRLLLIKPEQLPSIEGSFYPGWWLPKWGNQGAIIEKHPAIARFPNEGFMGMQFRALVGGKLDVHKLLTLKASADRVKRGYTNTTNGKAILYKKLPVEPDLIVHGLTWYRIESDAGTKPISYLCEFRVGSGKVLVTGFDLMGTLPEQNWLFDCLLRYCLSDSFNPKSTADTEQIRKWLTK